MIKKLLMGITLSLSLFLGQSCFALPVYTGLSHGEAFTFPKAVEFHKFIVKHRHEPAIQININSPGGYTTALALMLDDLRTYSGTVITNATGLVASCAAILYARGDIHKTAPKALLLFHQAFIEGDNGEKIRTHYTFKLSMSWVPLFKNGLSYIELARFLAGDDVYVPATKYINRVGH